MQQTRREMLRSTLAAGAGLGLAQWKEAFAAAPAAAGPYGALGGPDANGVRLPAGFSARLIAVSGQLVANSSYAWHFQPDGAATFPTPDGGWVYVSNAELNGTAGGVGAIRFSANGQIVGAYPILSGTKYNCAGGPTPWGSWLSCEEFRNGRVWECNPYQRGQGVVRPGMGVFAHEAAAVDPATGIVYLTEDDDTSRLYRFVPRTYGDLSTGRLEAAAVDTAGQVTWREVSSRQPDRSPATTAFARGEGAWFSGGFVYFCTTSDDRVWALQTATDQLGVIYDAAALGANAPLREPDNVSVHPSSGEIFVGEDDDNLECVLLAPAAGMYIAAPFVQFVRHEGSEVTGLAFNPDGSKLYVTSQRGIGRKYDSPGMTFEVSGPFRKRA